MEKDVRDILLLLIERAKETDKLVAANAKTLTTLREAFCSVRDDFRVAYHTQTQAVAITPHPASQLLQQYDDIIQKLKDQQQ